jgi:hypothetical protein
MHRTFLLPFPQSMIDTLRRKRAYSGIFCDNSCAQVNDETGTPFKDLRRRKRGLE